MGRSASAREPTAVRQSPATKHHVGGAAANSLAARVYQGEDVPGRRAHMLASPDAGRETRLVFLHGSEEVKEVYSVRQDGVRASEQEGTEEEEPLVTVPPPESSAISQTGLNRSNLQAQGADRIQLKGPFP